MKTQQRTSAGMDPLSRTIRHDILSISHKSGHGHIPTCFSVVDQLVAVYRTIRHDPTAPKWEERDLFVLSKGHASLAHYCTLAAFGYFDVKDVYTFGHFESRFGCHADRLKVPGVEVSTGSLGHGIGVASGMALGAQILGKDRRVVTLIGDGEANEGTVWEATMVAADLSLSNLTIIVDFNQSQTRCLQIPNPAERFSAFGCDVVEVPGHDVELLSSAIGRKTNKVNVVIAHAKKGYGSHTLEGNFHEWHRRSPDADMYQKLTEELNA